MGAPLNILGISAFYHDAAAALVRDGEPVAAAQEERFTRKKHDPRFPVNAMNYCLEEGEIEASDLAAVVFYDNPILTLDRVIHSLIAAGEEGLEQWLHGAPDMLGIKLRVKERICNEFQTDVKVMFSEHHFSHAASAFYPSPYREAAILTLDGVGEWATTTLGSGKDNEIRILKEQHFPHSLGLLYSAFTQYCGFKVNSGEYKLMGLAPYGKPVYADRIRSKLISINEDGSFRLNMDYFGFTTSRSMINSAFEELFEGLQSQPESRITQREMDLAASIQLVTEEVVGKIARHLHELTNLPRLCLAGGVALNCVANGKLLREGVYENMWIQPAAGDAGGALGAALYATHQYFRTQRKPSNLGKDKQHGSYLGPQYSKTEIRAFLDYFDYPYEEVEDSQRAARVAAEIARGNTVGYFVGRMEFGPRALGARSILGDARSPKTQSVMNQKIKYRESFRPFAPAVLADQCRDFFEMDVESPYMLIVAPVRKELCQGVTEIEGDDVVQRINQVRSLIPAVTHVDYSARVQTVGGEKPDFYKVLQEMDKLTGVPVIVNTSFNVRGEPIVCTPIDGYICFMRTELDILVLENFFLYKNRQPKFDDNKEWMQEYELD